MELWGSEVMLLVAQIVHSLPRAPALQSHVDVLPFLLGGGIGVLGHVVIAVDGQLATLRQVLKFGYERVEALYVTRLVQRFIFNVFRLFVEKHEFAGEECSVAIADFHIVVAHLPSIVRRQPNDAQQVVAEIATVFTLDDEGLKVGGFHLCQLVRIGHGLVIVVLPYLLVAQLVKPAVVIVDVAQDGIVDSLQHMVVLGLLSAFLQLFHGRQQRVGRHFALRAGTLQLSFQQLTVGFLFLGFCHYLTQHFLLRLRQVVVLGVFHLLPQGAVCLGVHHRSKE